jgi:hypothetical protein
MEIKTKSCEKCEAKWMSSDGGKTWQHYWHTGATGSEADLAGLVCDNIPDSDLPQCLNPLRGTNHGGDTWDSRFNKAKELVREIDDQVDKLGG